MSVANIIQMCALTQIVERSKTPEITALKLDRSLINAMLDFNTDILAKYLKDAQTLLKSGFDPKIHAHISKEDQDALKEDLAEIHRFAASSKEALKLRGNVNYTPEQISSMVYVMALKSASEKANPLIKKPVQALKIPSSIAANLQHVGGPLHEQRPEPPPKEESACKSLGCARK